MDKTRIIKKLTIVVISVSVLSLITCLIREKPVKVYPELSVQERKKMDIKLFNELSVVNSGWIGKTRKMRYELIKSMANQGFEIADLAIDLLDVKPGSWRRSFNRSAYKRLLFLAEQGDPSAQCLVTLVISRWDIDQSKDYESFVVSSAKADHAHCSYLLSLYMMPPYQNKQTIERNERKGKKLFLRAAKRGVQPAQLYLVNFYAQGRNNYPLDIGKARCWFTLAQRADTGKTISTEGNLNRWTRMAKEKGLTNFNEYDPEQGCENFNTTETITTIGGTYVS